MIADFVGNAGRHTLVSPIDVLSGNYKPAVVAKAKELAKAEGSGDPADQLARAELEVKALAATIRASRVQYTAKAFDPFAILRVRPSVPGNYDRTPMSEKQVAYLKRYMGLTDKDMGQIGKLEASRLIGAEETRRREGLASFKQLKMLRKYGAARINVTRNLASAAMDYLKQKNWRGADIDRDRLDAILRGKVSRFDPETED